MPVHIEHPKVIPAAGDPPKRIEEYIGRVNSGTAGLSVARMLSPQGWAEPGQTPEFAEYTLVLAGCHRIESREAVLTVHAGEAVIAYPGEWVRYSTPDPGGAETIAVCLPAFSPALAHQEFLWTTKTL